MITDLRVSNVNIANASVGVSMDVRGAGSSINRIEFDGVQFENVTNKWDFEDVTSVVRNGIGEELSCEETPTVTYWEPGDIIELTDTETDQHRGLFLLLPDLSWQRIGTSDSRTPSN